MLILAFAFSIALLIIRDTFRFGISPMPSSKRVRKALLEHIPKLPGGPIIDLGSGWGDLVIDLATCYPDRKIIGYEGALIPFLISKLRTLGKENIEIHKRNFLDEDLESALLVTYLYRKGMEDLSYELRGREKPFRLISHTFHLPHFSATDTWKAPDLYRTPIFLYEY